MEMRWGTRLAASLRGRMCLSRYSKVRIMRIVRQRIAPGPGGLCLLVLGMSKFQSRRNACAGGCQGGSADAIEQARDEKGTGPWYEDFGFKSSELGLRGGCSARKSGYGE